MAEPFFFGPEPDALFGVYHAPETVADRDLAVLIAPPFGREYLKTHRALRQLAKRLARSGFHALRFDYRGCGDSGGDPAQSDVNAWTDDLELAVDELKDRAGIGRVAIVGLRLGGTLGLLAAARRRDIPALVLWEPILDGTGYVTELVALGEDWHRLNRLEAEVEGVRADVMGFPLGEPMAQSLSSLSLSFTRRPTRRVLLLAEDKGAPGARGLLEQLEGLGVGVEEKQTHGARIWLDTDGEIARALIPQGVLGTAVDWLTEVGS